MDLGIEERVALVTGAGQGIGRQICLTLAKEGVRVAVNDIAEELATAAAAEIGQAGGQAIGVSADVTDADAVNVMVQQVLQKWGRVDILVNNAGIPLAASYQEPTPGGGPLFQRTGRAFWDLTTDIITDGTQLHASRHRGDDRAVLGAHHQHRFRRRSRRGGGRNALLYGQGWDCWLQQGSGQGSGSLLHHGQLRVAGVYRDGFSEGVRAVQRGHDDCPSSYGSGLGPPGAA